MTDAKRTPSGQLAKEAKPTDAICPNCIRRSVECSKWESSDGAYEDYKYRCYLCGHTWWVDGADA
jgi:hypothetical protein